MPRGPEYLELALFKTTHGIPERTKVSLCPQRGRPDVIQDGQCDDGPLGANLGSREVPWETSGFDNPSLADRVKYMLEIFGRLICPEKIHLVKRFSVSRIFFL